MVRTQELVGQCSYALIGTVDVFENGIQTFTEPLTQTKVPKSLMVERRCYVLNAVHIVSDKVGFAVLVEAERIGTPELLDFFPDSIRQVCNRLHHLRFETRTPAARDSLDCVVKLFQRNTSSFALGPTEHIWFRLQVAHHAVILLLVDFAFG